MNPDIFEATLSLTNVRHTTKKNTIGASANKTFYERTGGYALIAC
jgi:hypothetical protein